MWGTVRNFAHVDSCHFLWHLQQTVWNLSLPFHLLMNISSDSELKKQQITLAKYIHFLLIKKVTCIHVFLSTLTNDANKTFSAWICYFDYNPGKVQICRQYSPLAQAVAAQLQPYKMLPFPGLHHVPARVSLLINETKSDEAGTSIFNSELLPKVL